MWSFLRGLVPIRVLFSLFFRLGIGCLSRLALAFDIAYDAVRVLNRIGLDTLMNRFALMVFSPLLSEELNPDAMWSIIPATRSL